MFLLLLNSAWYDLLRSQLVCIPPGQLSAPLSSANHKAPPGISRVKSCPYHCSLPDPGTASVCSLTCCRLAEETRKQLLEKLWCVCIGGVMFGSTARYQTKLARHEQRTHCQNNSNQSTDQKQVYSQAHQAANPIPTPAGCPLPLSLPSPRAPEPPPPTCTPFSGAHSGHHTTAQPCFTARPASSRSRPAQNLQTRRALAARDSLGTQLLGAGQRSAAVSCNFVLPLRVSAYR
jgi:hypothetical protein